MLLRSMDEAMLRDTFFENISRIFGNRFEDRHAIWRYTLQGNAIGKRDDYGSLSLSQGFLSILYEA